jgi:glycosyltransferase involved in cell wall biosynthesis
MNVKGISVIVPNYNNEKYIEQCLSSIINQSYRPIEIIVVDDCSTDNSVEIIKSFVSEHNSLIVPVFLDRNRGVSYARNKGVNLAKYQYITYIDADDFYTDCNKLRNEMDLLEKHKMKIGKEVIAYSPVIYCSEEGNVIRTQGLDKNLFSVGDISIKLIAGVNLSRGPRDCLIPKMIFTKAGGFNEKITFYEDYDLSIRMALLCNFVCTYKYGTSYRQKEGGLSSKPYSEHVRAKREIQKKYFKKLPVKCKGICLMFRMWQILRYDIWFNIKLLIPMSIKKPIKGFIGK